MCLKVFSQTLTIILGGRYHAPQLRNEEREGSPKESHLANHKANNCMADQDLNTGQGWFTRGERDWRQSHSTSVRRLVQVWSVRAWTKLRTRRIVEKYKFWQMTIKVAKPSRRLLKQGSEWRAKWHLKSKQSLWASSGPWLSLMLPLVRWAVV